VALFTTTKKFLQCVWCCY